MTKKQSAGILLYRFRDKTLEVFLVHPGGPFWKNKDLGVWSIPKGEFADGEDPLTAAKRELEEELGATFEGAYIELSPIRQRSGKTVYAWAVEADFDPAILKSNTFMLEWPPKSAKQKEFPEIDRGGWFSVEEAKQKLIAAQGPLIDELVELVR